MATPQNNYSLTRTDIAASLERFGFGPQVPEETRRSAGLDPQSMIIAGFGLSTPCAEQLTSTIKPLGEAGLYVYGSDQLHITIGVGRVLEGERAHTNPEHLPLEHQGDIETLIGITLAQAGQLHDTMIGPVRLLANGDSIIGVPEVPDALLMWRENILSAAARHGVQLDPAWGVYLTLARFTSGLSPAQRQMVNEILGQIPPIGRVEVDDVFAGILIVTDGKVQLHRAYTAEMPG